MEKVQKAFAPKNSQVGRPKWAISLVTIGTRFCLKLLINARNWRPIHVNGLYTGTKYSFKHIELFRDYERKAREAGKGVWGNSDAAGFTGSQTVESNEGLGERTYEVQQFQGEFERQNEKIEFLIQQLEYVQKLLAFQMKNNLALSEQLENLSQIIEDLNQ